jgi:P27 family predicted phage terminase small subunit
MGKQQPFKSTLRFKADLVPPAHLSEAAALFWQRVVREYAMHDDEVGLAILTSAMEAWDRSEQARAVIEREGIAVKDRYGRPRAHPLLSVQARFADQYRAAIKQLRFDTEPVHPGPGRPPGR